MPRNPIAREARTYGAAALMAAAAILGAGGPAAGTVITSVASSTSTTMTMEATGQQYDVTGNYGGDWYIRNVEGSTTGLDISGARVRWAFQIPQEVYEHRLLKSIKVGVYYRYQDAGCSKLIQDCDDLPSHVEVYDWQGGSYRVWMNLRENSSAMWKEELTTWNTYPDDVRSYVSRPETDEVERVVRIVVDVPDGNGSNIDDDAEVQIHKIVLTLNLKQDEAPGLSHRSPSTIGGKVNVPVGEDASFEVTAGAAPEGHGVLEYHWMKALRTQPAPTPLEDFGDRTTGPVRNIRFEDPGEYVVYAKVLYKTSSSATGSDHIVISKVLATPVRAWDRPTVQDRPPQAAISAGQVSWYDGKYAGVVGEPVYLMGAGDPSGDGDSISEVEWDLDSDWGRVEAYQTPGRAVSHTWDSATQNAQIRFRVRTDFGIASHGDLETGKTVALAVYDTVRVDPHTGPGDSYSGRVNAEVALTGAITNAYVGSPAVAYQWRVDVDANGLGGTPLQMQTTTRGEATHTWTTEGTHRVALTATVTTAEGLELVGTGMTEVMVEAGRPTAMPGGPYRGGIAGGNFSPIALEGNHPDFVEAEDVGKIREWIWTRLENRNGALELDGNLGRIAVPEVVGFPSTSLTVEFWMKSAGTHPEGTLISYAIEGGSDNELVIYRPSSLGTLVAGNRAVAPDMTLLDDAWHHVAVTWRSSDGALRLYRDGVEMHETTVSQGESLADGGYLIIGQEQDAHGGGFQSFQAYEGLIDEVMVWKGCRTTEQVRDDMTGRVGGDEEGLVLYWTFEDSSDATVSDQTDQNDGTVMAQEAGGWVAAGHPEVTRGTWNPAYEYPVAGRYEMGLSVLAVSGKWSSLAQAAVTAVDGAVAGHVRAADLRTPVGEARVTLESGHVDPAALARVAVVDSSLHTTAGGRLWTLTDEGGQYAFRHLPLGSYRARVSKGEGNLIHEFEQTSKSVELTLDAPGQLAVDFVDLSVFPVGGRVVYSLQKNGQDVLEQGVTVTAQPLASTSDIQGLPSTRSRSAAGTNYSLPLFAGKYLMLAQKSDRDIRIRPATLGYDGTTGLLTIEEARTDVDFVDHTTRTLTVLVRDSGGNPVAVYPSHFSNAGEPIEVTVSGNNGQVSDAAVAATEDEMGVLTAILNPGVYTVRIPGARPEEEEVDLTGGDREITMTVPVKIEVELSARPHLLDDEGNRDILTEFGLGEDGNPEGFMFWYPPEPRTHTYTVRATANGYPVEDFALEVRDEVSMVTADPPEERELAALGDTIAYTMTAGLPKTTEDDPPLAAPKRITFRATREGYEDSDVVADSVIVLGDIAVGTAAKIVSIPVVNYTVLHDPPGDGSYAYLDDALSVSGVVRGMQIKTDNAEVPVYPSPWSAERTVDGFEFADTTDVDTPFSDMRTKGLLGTRSTMPSAAHFSYTAAIEGGVGAGIVAIGPIGYVVQLVKLGAMAASLAPETYPVGEGIVQYEVSPARALETPSGDEIPDLLGPGKGDIYFGEGWTLGLQTKYRMGLERDTTAATWRLTTEQIETYDILERSNQYVYCTRDIENIIADLNRTIDDPRTDPEEREKLEAAIGTWTELLNANLAHIWQRDYVSQGKSLEQFLDGPGASLNEDESETLIFSAGPTFEYSRTIVNSSLAEVAYEVAVETASELGHELENKAGFEFLGTGVTIHLTMGSTAGIASGTSFGASWESGTVAEQSVGFVLNDDDVGDNISTRVYADPRWGTPIFFQDGGSYTSDPWEMGTNKNVDVTLELLDEPEGPFDYHEGAHYLVKVRYTGQRVLETATVDFTIYEYPQLDIGNLTARFNGNPGPYDLPVTKQEPSIDVAVSVYPPDRDLNNSFEKEYSIAIEVDEIEDPSQIFRVLTLTPTFADLRAPRAKVVAPYPGQRISPVFFPAESPFEVLVVSEDTDVAKIQMQIRGKQPDGVWEPWRNLPGMVWVEGADNPAVSVFDRLDRRPPRREFTFDWQESSIRSLGVGEYALQAIATDKATPDANTDIAPPFVVFRVDEAKPSVLNTLPDYQARESERMYRGELSVTFTDDMRPTDFDDRTMEVYDLLDGGKRVAGYVSYSPALRKVVFVPVIPFQPNGYYQVLVKTDEDTDGDGAIDRRGVHDLAGNPLDNAFSWSFRTTEAPFEPTWSMVWSAEDGQGSDGNKIAAVEYGAEDGLDEKDALSVPGLAAQLHLGFVDREQRAYERDTRPADGRLSHHWFMVVDNAAAGAAVTLKWQPSIRLIRSTRDYQQIRLVEFDAVGQVTNTVSLDPTQAQIDQETGLIEPLVAYTYTSGGETSRYFRLDVQRTGAVTSRLTAGTSGWKFLSVPITPQVAEPFVNLGDDIDPFRLYQYDADIAGYWIYPFDLGDVGLLKGRGYFTRLEQDADVDVGGALNHMDVTRVLRTPGWHAIGNPFLVDVAAGDLLVNGQSFGAAVSAGTVEGTLYRWDTVSPEEAFLSSVPSTDGYAAVTSGDALEPWQGYWLRTWTPDVELTMPAPSGIELVQPETPDYLQPPIAKPALAGNAPGPGEFELALALRSPVSSDLSTSLGARSGARPERDGMDESEPPILGNTVAAYFTHLDWGEAAGQYNTDFRPPLEVGESQIWTVTALAASEVVEGEPAELSWAESVDQAPDDVVLHFRSLAEAGGCDCEVEWRDMRSLDGVSLPSSRLSVARYEVRAERIGLLAPRDVALEAGEEQVTLRWRADDRNEVTGYTIRRHPGTTADWDRGQAERIELEQVPGLPLAEFVDVGVAGGATYTYEVATRYRSGAEAAAAPVSVTSIAGVERTALLQSFPNPANPELWIPYELERESAVRIEIYNATGQLVRVLDRGVQARGRYVGPTGAAHWDGCDESGTRVGSGMYLYRLVAGDYFETRRMVLLR